MSDIQVTVAIPSELWWMLGDLAEKRDQKISDVVVEALADVVTPARVRQTQHRFTAADAAALQRLHGLNYSDREIAQKLGFHLNTVTARRNLLGLPTVRSVMSGRREA